MRPFKIVHISPVGFEVERIVRPIKYHSANKVILIIEKDSRYKSFLDAVKRDLKGIHIEIREVSNFWDFEQNMNLYVELLSTEINKNNNVWINLSSGSKLHATIGFLSSQMFGFVKGVQHAFPYYVKAKDGYRSEKAPDYRRRGLARVPEISEDTSEEIIIEPFLFPVEQPKRELIELLENLKGRGKVKAKDLMGLVEGKAESGKDTTLAKSARLLRLISPAVNLDLVQKEGKTRSKKYSLTRKGEMYLNSFKVLIKDRSP